MTYITLTAEQIRQIEEALKSVHGLSGINMAKPLDIIRAARAQYPVATMEVFSGWGDEANFEQLHFDLPDGVYKLYAAPVEPMKQEPVIPAFLRRPGSFGHE